MAKPARTDAPPPPLLRTADVAEVLQCSPKHVTTLIHDGKLAAVRVGARFRVHREDLEKFLRRNRTVDL